MDTLTADRVACLRAYVALMRRARLAGLQHCTYGVFDVEHTWESGGRWDGVRVSLFCGQLELRRISPDPHRRVRLSMDEGLSPAGVAALADVFAAAGA